MQNKKGRDLFNSF